MDYTHSDGGADDPVPPTTAKILIAGGFGVGKTTLVSAVSEIRPLRTEETLRPVPVPVRHARPGTVLVHVGRTGLWCPRSGDPG